MRRIYALSFAAILCAGYAHAETQASQTDYQRMMNSVNNASSQAFGQPQPDPGAIDSSGNTTPNGNTPNASPGTNTPPDASQSAYGFSGGSQTNVNGVRGLNGSSNALNSPYGGGGVNPNGSTTSGTIGLGSYNASPYNTAPTTAGGNPYGGSSGYGGGRGATTPTFTGQ